MINAERYLEKKAKGLAEVVQAGGGYAVAYKKFDADTGEALEPEIQAVSLDDLNKQKADLQSQIDDIDALIADINELE